MGRRLDDLRLTEWTSCGGCAAKWGAALLAELVADLPAPSDPSLLVGLAPFDDAAIYRIDDTTALVSTTDFFPPLVDDPADFGAIAAANACSDVFAMGGRVVLAINVAAFPEHFPRDAIAAIFDAAAQVVAEAGGTVAGGHTIRNPEPVFGLAVQGLVHPRAGVPQVGRPTRRLGAALQAARHRPGPRRRGRRREGRGGRRHATPSTGRPPRRCSPSVTAVHAVTDVTGYGLAGHGWEVAERSGVRARHRRRGLRRLSGRRARRRRAVGRAATPATATTSPAASTRSASPAVEALCFDPQTSGGLLAAVEPDVAVELLGARLLARRRADRGGEPVLVLR